jgi:hypothetical protein
MSALLYVYISPGSVPETEFNAWYDEEHAPNRLTVPGIHNGFRYFHDDGAKPEWLALYDMDSASVLNSPEYIKMYNSASDNEKKIKTQVEVIDRRVYELITEKKAELFDGSPAGFVLSVSMDPSDKITADEIHKWYEEEHVPLFTKIPGWIRTRRYKLVDGGLDGTPKFLALHEWKSMDFTETEEYKHAVSTPWRNEVVEKVAGNRERRMFKFYKSFTRK